MYRDDLGHAFVQAEGWIYPCLGCGMENRDVGNLRCTKPYSDPVGTERLLVEIRDLLKELVELLRKPG